MAFLIIGILLLSLSFLICIFYISYRSEYFTMLPICIGVVGLIFISIYIQSIPNALDVYKGKTQLRITYEGNTPVDSIVVFK